MLPKQNKKDEKERVEAAKLEQRQKERRRKKWNLAAAFF